MLGELGQFALVLALCMAAIQSIYGVGGAARGDTLWQAAVRPAAFGQLLFVAIAYAALTGAFVQNDFSVAYVAQNSNAALPLPYRLAAVWGGHEGSVLLWTLILAVWTTAVAVFSRGLATAFSARALGVMGLISLGFLLFLLTTSSPFERLTPPAAEGRDLNPLLQDPGMVMHPPLLYLGYVGMSVPFAFSVAGLLEGRLDAAWARWIRPWTLLAWVCLTVGITLGSWWAYNELGWGGWWFWDPVENASFMPWLVTTALLHSLAVTDKRALFRAWTVLLSIFAFSLSLLGTFLVRSGVLTSVHAFVTDPARGVFILGFLAFVVGGALLLYALRAPAIRRVGDFAPLSRETLLIANNVLLSVAAATVLLGTLYPLALDAAGLGKVSVGAPYFESVFVPLMVPLVLALALGPLTRWRRDRLRRVLAAARLPAALALAGAVAVAVLGGSGTALFSATGVGLGLWVVLSTLRDIADKLGHGRLTRQPAGVWGMWLAHLGVAVFVAGAAAASVNGEEADVRLGPGEAARLAGYRFVFEGARTVEGPNWTAREARIAVSRDGENIAVLHPQKRSYPGRDNAMTESAVDIGLWRDLYVALGEPLEGETWSVRLYHKPLVRWIWTGALVMALGGLIAAGDRRYRLARETARAGRGARGPSPEETRA